MVRTPGYQGRSTRGGGLGVGAKGCRSLGHDGSVRAASHTRDGLSAHADRTALLDWTGACARPPARTVVVHGEVQASQALAAALRQRPGWRVTVPTLGEEVQWPDPPGVP